MRLVNGVFPIKFSLLEHLQTKMRIEPAELAVVQFGMKRNLVARIVRNVQDESAPYSAAPGGMRCT